MQLPISQHMEIQESIYVRARQNKSVLGVVNYLMMMLCVLCRLDLLMWVCVYVRLTSFRLRRYLSISPRLAQQWMQKTSETFYKHLLSPYLISVFAVCAVCVCVLCMCVRTYVTYRIVITQSGLEWVVERRYSGQRVESVSQSVSQSIK